jgi:hypothetical protein
MRTKYRRKLICELWRVKERLHLGVETQDNLAVLAARYEWLLAKLGGQRPWGVRAPTAFPDGRIGEKGSGTGNTESRGLVPIAEPTRGSLPCIRHPRAQAGESSFDLGGLGGLP